MLSVSVRVTPFPLKIIVISFLFTNTRSESRATTFPLKMIADSSLFPNTRSDTRATPFQLPNHSGFFLDSKH